MQTAELASRLDARRISGGWIARCPAHQDRRPSLSISDGRDGRILIRCHAGCEPSAIVAALGLQFSNLFSDDQVSPPAPSSRPTAEEIESALRAECNRIKAAEAESLGFEPAELTRHRNAARDVIERRYSVTLRREPSPWWETEPHCTDPEWRGLIDRAIDELAFSLDTDPAELKAAFPGMAGFQADALCTARRLQQELATGTPTA
jgi:hypothetical protein